MFSVMLSLLLVGQCGPRGCPAPALGGGYSLPSVSLPAIRSQGTLTYDGPALTPRPAPARIAEPQRSWIPTRHAGLRFYVWGYLADGKVVWDDRLPENIQQQEKAQLEAKAKAKPEAKEPYVGIDGVDPTKFGGDGPKYLARSSEAERYVLGVEGSYGAPGNSKLHVTVIGTEADRKQVVQDINTNPEFSGLRDHLEVADFAPTDWQVDPSLGFQAGKPAIYVQAGKGIKDTKGGRVLYRASDYSMGAHGLAEAIRKADPDYKPSNDPGPATGKTDDLLSLVTANAPLCLAVLVATLLLLLPSRKDS